MVPYSFVLGFRVPLRLDLVDITREALVLLGNVQYRKIVVGYNAKNATGVEQAGEQLLQIFDDLDSILSTHEHFLLGKWIRAARLKGTNQTEAELYEYNFR